MELLKNIVSDRTRMAEISHAKEGVLYYKVVADGSIHFFPIDMNDKEDIGTATFNGSEKAITLMRYIRRAIGNNSLISVKIKV